MSCSVDLRSFDVRPNQRLHLTPLVGAEAERTRGTLQGTGSLFQVSFWVLVPGFQKKKYVSRRR